MHRAGSLAGEPQALQRDARSPARKRVELRTDATQSFEAAKGGVDARSNGKDQKPHLESTSPRKVAANRRNGPLSKGPKTKRGKSHSRHNAFKHGILSDALLITEGPGAEDKAAFYEWLRSLRLAWEPEGDREEELVEEIAICDWRVARALRCEGGLISRGVVIHQAGPAPEVAGLRSILGRDAENKRDQELKALTDHLSLPLGNPLDRLLRYQTTIQRLKALKTTELERLQLRRKGQHVPAPVSVQFSTD